MTDEYQGLVADADGTKLHYYDVGRGEPLILLHGGGAGASGLSNWRRNIGPLSKHFRVLTVDQPGYGLSDNKIGSEGLFASHAEAILALMNRLGLQRASFVGNSLGGGTTLALALREPDRVNKMVLMGPGGMIPVCQPWPSEGLRRMFDFYEGEGPTIEKMRGIVRELVYDPKSIPESLIQERFTAATRPQYLAAPPLRNLGTHPNDELWRAPLNRLTHETLLTWGREDRTLPIDAAFIPLKVIPNAELHVFPKCGHWAQYERAELFNEVITLFLKRPAAEREQASSAGPMRGSYAAKLN
jgi:pimeloyl-ACP methyl ester carboxylesterase